MTGRAKRADVFISYDRRSSADETKRLSRDLEAAGISTWWDTQNMRAGDDFQQVIDRNLDLCKAAIIIWTPESVKSRWVRAEADHASRLDKLINTHVDGLDPATIPKPFNLIHSVRLADRQAIVDALKPYLRARKKRKSETDQANMPLVDTDPKLRVEPVRPNRPGFRVLLLGLLAAALAAGVAAIVVLDPFSAPVPRWSFEYKSVFLGEEVPLAWAYEPPQSGPPVRYEIKSEPGGSQPEICTDSHHYFVDHINGTRSWRVRAVTDCSARTPVSSWSKPVTVTQYDSVYDRIKATGRANVYVSDSQDQDVFKWGDSGVDIDLTELILKDLSARTGRDVRLILHPVSWDTLLPEAGKGTADFSISSITKRPYREQENAIKFSDPYFCTTHALIFRAGTPDAPISDMVAGKIVGAQKKSTSYKLAEELSGGELFSLESFNNTESLKNALRKSRIDFAVTDTSFAQSAQLDTRLSDGADQLQFKEFGPNDMPPSMQGQDTQNYAVAVHKGEIELLNAINVTIAKAKQDGRLKQLFDRASERYEAAHHYAPGSRNLGERPWDCASRTAAGP